MKDDKVTIIGGKSGYTEIIIEDDFEIVNTKESERIIYENLRIIRGLKKKAVDKV